MPEEPLELEVLSEYQCVACAEPAYVLSYGGEVGWSYSVLRDEIELTHTMYGVIRTRYRYYHNPDISVSGGILDYWCEQCSDELFCACEDCSEIILDADTTRVEDGYRTVCMQCFEDNYTYCEDCEEQYHIDVTRGVEGGNRTVCDSCMGNYNYCIECDEAYHYEAMEYDEDEECYVCNDCHHERVPRIIQSYSFRPVLAFRWSAGKHGHGFYLENQVRRRMSLLNFYGTELEVEPKPGGGATFDMVQEMAQYIHDTYGSFLYLKRDGSVPNGFEIVSHPATLQWWREHGTKMYGDILMRLRRSGFQSHNGGHCGFHIHTNKSALTRLQLMRMAEFIYSPQLNNRLRALSRRGRDSLNTYASLKIPTRFDPDESDYIQLDAKDYAKQVARERSTYTRGALHVGSATAELRLFRGSLRDDRLWASLEFYDLLIQYCKNGEPGQPNWNEFRSYVHAAPREYSDLKSLFLEKQY